MSVRAACLLLTAAAILGAAPAAAQGCPFDREVTVSETILGWKPNEQYLIGTFGYPFPNCSYAFVSYKGTPPAACKQGATFTATGRLKRVASDPSGKYGVFEATRLSCK